MAGPLSSRSRRRSRRAAASSAIPLVASLVVVVLLGPRPAPVLAETTVPGPSTSTTAPGPTTTSPPDPTSTPTSAPASVGPDPSDTTTTAPGSEPVSTTASTPPTSEDQPAADPDGEDGNGEDGPDPLVDEGKSEDAPGVDPEIPPPPGYGDQEPYRPPEVLWSSVTEAERRLERSRETRREAVAEVRALRLQAKRLGLARQALDDRSGEAADELTDATERFQIRAVTDYRIFAAGTAPDPTTVIDPSDLPGVMEDRRGSRLAEAALVVGQGDLDELSRLRQELDGEARSLLDRQRLVSEYLAEAELAALEAEAEVDQATIEYEAFRAGSEVYVSGVRFPIDGPYELPLIDSFGFPRMTGTPDEHWHEGIDIFAPRGTPLVAAERGVVTRIGVGRLGGLKLWLVGESGSEWYYAHLDTFAPGLADGRVVEAGDLLGHVGNTGNAVGTPPHLHLQLHPDGGRPVNPFPLLKIVSDLDQEQLTEG